MPVRKIASTERALDAFERLAREDRLVGDDRELCPGGKVALNRAENLLHAVGRRQCVRAGLLDDLETDAGCAISPVDLRLFLVRVDDDGDVAEVHWTARAVRNGQIAKLLRIAHERVQPNVELLAVILDRATWRVDVFRCQRVVNLENRHAVGAKLVLVDLYLNLTLQTADDANRADAVDGAEPWRHGVICHPVEIAETHRSRERDVHDRQRVEVCFEDVGRQ